MARAPISPPTPRPVRTGLLASTGRTDIPAERWQYGVAYRPRRYDAGASIDTRDCAPQTLTITAHPDVVEWDAWTVWWGEVCDAARPEAFAEAEQAAVANLDAHLSHLVEETVWSGKVDGAAFGPPNVGLVDAPTLLASGAQVGVVEGWRLVLDYASDVLRGARGMIHVPYEALALLDYYGLVTREGTLIMAGTADHLVVAGTGYTGSGPGDVLPGGDDRWFAVTSLYEVRVGPVEVSSDPAETLDRGSNTVEVRAWRPVLAHFDRQAHAMVRVCLEDPGPLCSGS